MSQSWTYTTLKTAVVSHIDGDTSSTGGLAATANFDVLLKAGEERILLDLPLTLFDAEADITLTQSTLSVTKPTGYVTWRSANFTNGSGNKVPLDRRSIEYLEDYWPNASTEGTPKYLADTSSTTWKVAPTPNATFSGKAWYVKRPTSLVTDTSGTWISQNAGLLLFRACLANGSEFIKNDKRAAVWEADYQKTLQASYREFRHLLRPGFENLAAMPTAR